MKIRTIRTIESGDRVVTLRTEEFSQEEIRWISEQGEPEVDLGGTFTLADEVTTFDLPSAYARVMSGLRPPGAERRFSSEAHDDPSAAALAWEAEMVSRISAAMEQLHDSDVSGFSGESVSQPSYV